MSDSSTSNQFNSDPANEATVSDFILGKKLSITEESKALKNLRLISPSSILIDLATDK